MTTQSSHRSTPRAMERVPDIPRRRQHAGNAVTLEPLGLQHLRDLWEAVGSADRSWAYLRYGPFPTQASLAEHLVRIGSLELQPFFAVLPASSGRAEGWASFCDILPDDKAIEIGSIWFSPRMQRTRAATETIFIMIRHAFEMGYERVAWRCNSRNVASMGAAKRFGFTYEGTWRGDAIVKGSRRDTAWFSMLRAEWPVRRARFEAWLDDCNFNDLGMAKTSLSSVD